MTSKRRPKVERLTRLFVDSLTKDVSLNQPAPMFYGCLTGLSWEQRVFVYVGGGTEARRGSFLFMGKKVFSLLFVLSSMPHASTNCWCSFSIDE
jgi:hypothetical protein